MKKKFLCLVFAVLLCVCLPSFTAGATTITPDSGYNRLQNGLTVRYNVPAESEGWSLDGRGGGYRMTSSNHKVSNWGAYDGWRFTAPEGGETYMQYDWLQNDNDPPRVSQFYTMLSNFTKGLTKVSITLRKLEAGEIIDFEMKFYDTVPAKSIAPTDFTALYNAADVGSFVTISQYIDLSYAGSLDSFIIWAKADIKAVKFQIKQVDFEWGSTAIATADGAYPGLESGYNIAFNKMTRAGFVREYDWMPVTGFSNEYGAGRDSGRHGDYGFNHGSIQARNDEKGEYLSFSKGTDNSIGGIWLKFPLDLTRDKVNVRLVIQKKLAGSVSEVKLELLAAGGGGTTVPITLSANNGLPGGGGLTSMPAGVWNTYDFKDVDITGITKWDSLGIWVTAEGVAGQELYIADIGIYYDDIGPARSKDLTEADKTVNNVAFAAADGVSVNSDASANEYFSVDLASAQGGAVTAQYPASGLTAGTYKVVSSARKAAGSPVLTATVGGTDYALTPATDAWEATESAVFTLSAVPTAFTFRVSGSGVLDVAYVALVQVEAFIPKDIAFGVSSVFSRDFRAMTAMGVDEYDFSQNGFPEIGNWSDSFPDLRAQGQKVVKDTDGTPVMKIYRRTAEEIAAAKTEFNWPTGTNYVPAEKSHFFFTAPLSTGYARLQITVKRGEGFKGTADFSIEGYMGSEPWWELADFTAELNAAADGAWVTYSKDVYIPRAIDSVKVCIDTRYVDSDLFIKELRTLRKQSTADGQFEGDKGGTLSWDILTQSLSGLSVKLDDATLASSAYTLTADKFTLNEAFLYTLDNGNYAVSITDGTDTMTLTVYVSKIAPAVTSGKLTISLKKLQDLELDVNLRASGLSRVELNGKELEEGVDYTLNEDSTKLTLHKDALSGLPEGDATLTVRTRAGSVDYTFGVAKKLKGCKAVSMGAVLIGAAVGILLLKKKKGV
jgi:hypothetical protein